MKSRRQRLNLEEQAIAFTTGLKQVNRKYRAMAGIVPQMMRSQCSREADMARRTLDMFESARKEFIGMGGVSQLEKTLSSQLEGITGKRNFALMTGNAFLGARMLPNLLAMEEMMVSKPLGAPLIDVAAIEALASQSQSTIKILDQLQKNLALGVSSFPNFSSTFTIEQADASRRFAEVASRSAHDFSEGMQGYLPHHKKLLSVAQRSARLFHDAMPVFSPPQLVAGGLHTIDVSRVAGTIVQEELSIVFPEVELPQPLQNASQEISVLVKTKLSRISQEFADDYEEFRGLLVSGSSFYVPYGFHKAKDFRKRFLAKLAPSKKVAEKFGCPETKIEKKLRYRYVLRGASQDYRKVVMSMENFFVTASNQIGTLSHKKRVSALHGQAWAQLIDVELMFILDAIDLD